MAPGSSTSNTPRDIPFPIETIPLPQHNEEVRSECIRLWQEHSRRFVADLHAYLIAKGGGVLLAKHQQNTVKTKKKVKKTKMTLYPDTPEHTPLHAALPVAFFPQEAISAAATLGTEAPAPAMASAPPPQISAAPCPTTTAMQAISAAATLGTEAPAAAMAAAPPPQISAAPCPPTTATQETASGNPPSQLRYDAPTFVPGMPLQVFSASFVQPDVSTLAAGIPSSSFPVGRQQNPQFHAVQHQQQAQMQQQQPELHSQQAPMQHQHPGQHQPQHQQQFSSLYLRSLLQQQQQQPQQQPQQQQQQQQQFFFQAPSMTPMGFSQPLQGLQQQQGVNGAWFQQFVGARLGGFSCQQAPAL